MTTLQMKGLEVGEILLDVLNSNKWKDVVKCKVVEVDEDCVDGIIVKSIDKDRHGLLAPSIYTYDKAFLLEFVPNNISAYLYQR